MKPEAETTTEPKGKGNISLYADIEIHKAHQELLAKKAKGNKGPNCASQRYEQVARQDLKKDARRLKVKLPECMREQN